MNQPRGGRRHPGSTVLHARNCACPQCDPDDTKLKAARAAAKTAPRPAPVVLAKSAGARPIRFRRPESDQTRRLAELLRAGHTFASASEIIEAENAQRKDPTP